MNDLSHRKNSASLKRIICRFLFKKTVIVTAIILLPVVSCPQSLDKARFQLRLHEIQDSGNYKWGEGFGKSIADAKSAASYDMVTKIQSFIHAEGSRRTKETTSNLSDEWTKTTRLVASMQLQGLDYLDLGMKNDQHHYLAYVSLKDLERSNERQKTRIRELVGLANEAESKCNLDDALRQYYLAYLLTHTVMDTLALPLPNGMATAPGLALLEQMRQVMKGIQINADPCEREEGMFGVPVHVTYNRTPVHNLDFSYYAGDGTDYSHVTNGYAYLEYYTDPRIIESRHQVRKLQILYAYEGMMRYAPDLQELHDLYRDQSPNTWTNLELEFPWIEEEAGAKTTPVPPVQSDSTLMTTEWPVSILVLADQTATKDFLETLTSYSRNNRISVHKSRPDSIQNLYVAIVDTGKVRGVFHVERNGILDVRRGRLYPNLNQPKFAGASAIWMQVASREAYPGSRSESESH